MNEIELKELMELDAWIHRNLFGAPDRCLHLQITKLRGSLKQCDACGEQFGDTSLAMAYAQTPDFSTDPAAAMEVLKKCAEKCTITVEFGTTAFGATACMVAKLIDHDDGSYVEDFCKTEATLELAICLFAKQLFSQ